MKMVCFIILHFGDRKVTDQCVSSILKLNRQEVIRILIVDNNVYMTLEERKALFQTRVYKAENVRILYNESSEKGFSFANNMGYRFAAKYFDLSFVIIANNDIIFNDVDLIDKIAGIYSEQKFAVLAPDILRKSDHVHQNPLDVKLRTAEEAEYTIKMNQLALRFFDILYPLIRLDMIYKEKKRGKEGEIWNRKQERIVPYGACLIFSELYFRSRPLPFYPETEFYYEEYILAYQCQKACLKISYCPEISVCHDSGASTKANFRKEKEKLRFVLQNTARSCEVYKKMLQDDFAETV